MSDTTTPEVLSKAREMGWKPQEEFRGDASHWVDADEYVRRGEEVLPLVKAENRRLSEKTDTLTREIARLTGVVAEQGRSMDDFAKHAQEELQARLTDQKRQLSAALREARKEEDDALVETLEARLEENAEARAELKEKPAPTAAPVAPQSVPDTPEYLAWKGQNEWFGGTSEEDEARTAAAQRFGVKAAAEGKRGQAFFDAVDAQLAKAFPKQKRVDPTEEGRPGGGGSGSGSGGGKGFAALPSDAKAKAKEQAAKFVGPNKMFKKEADWLEYYAKQYNTEAA